MIHLRKRYLLSRIKKKLAFAPILFIQGARQVGKSLLLREIVAKELKLKYVTFDNNQTREMATESPHLFLQHHDHQKTLIIDEAQKVPKIFDSIKEIVDNKRTPGRYILLGSTEFSHLTNIRESLTGRATRTFLYPLLLSETKHLPLNNIKKLNLINTTPRVKLTDVTLYMERGGMPGLFAIRDQEERNIFLSDWINLTCQRDILQIKKLKLEPDLCYKLLEGICLIEFADETSLTKYTGENLRKVKNHLVGLENIFIIHRIPAHSLSTGKNLFFILDVAFAHFFKADLIKKIRTFIIQEQIAQRSYRGEVHTQYFFYRSKNGFYIDLIIEHEPRKISAIKIFQKEKFNELDIRQLESFKLKILSQSEVTKNAEIELYAFAPINEKMKINDVTIYPIESIC